MATTRGLSSLAIAIRLAISVIAVNSVAFAQSQAVQVSAEQGSQSAPPVPAAASSPPPTLALGLRFDCLHNFNLDKGAAQDCIAVTGLRFSIQEQVTSNLHASLRLDPFSTPRPSREDSPLRSGLPSTSDTALGIVDAFAVVWTARPGLALAVQSYDGAAMPANVSGLALANNFMDAGWKQTALTVTYSLSAWVPMQVALVAGNGEGQTTHSQTAQRYFGLEAKATVLKGLQLVFGTSANGNDAGSEEFTYVSKQYASSCGIPAPATTGPFGHATRRTAAGLVFDAATVGATGLKLGFGWQSNFTKDLTKNAQAYPLLTQLQQSNCQLDPDYFFPEQAGILNSARRTTFDLSAQYRMLGKFFVGADYTLRRFSTGSVPAFHLCDGYTNNQCSSVNSGDRSQLLQMAWTAGAGVTLTDGLDLSIEYYESLYDKSYAQFFYAGPNGQASKELDVFNARLAYRWQ